jgi:hypothetical protein
MKKLPQFLVFCFLPLLVQAEGKAKGDWAEEAAVRYEEKAVHAANSGNAEAAQIYRKMAQMKRDAGAASKAGKKYDWSEYHELQGQLNAMNKKTPKGFEKKIKKQWEKKKDWEKKDTKDWDKKKAEANALKAKDKSKD